MFNSELDAIKVLRRLVAITVPLALIAIATVSPSANAYQDLEGEPESVSPAPVESCSVRFINPNEATVSWDVGDQDQSQVDAFQVIHRDAPSPFYIVGATTDADAREAVLDGHELYDRLYHRVRTVNNTSGLTSAQVECDIVAPESGCNAETVICGTIKMKKTTDNVTHPVSNRHVIGATVKLGNSDQIFVTKGSGYWQFPVEDPYAEHSIHIYLPGPVELAVAGPDKTYETNGWGITFNEDKSDPPGPMTWTLVSDNDTPDNPTDDTWTADPWDYLSFGYQAAAAKVAGPMYDATICQEYPCELPTP